MDKLWFHENGFYEVTEVKDIRYDKTACDHNYQVLLDLKPSSCFFRFQGTDKEMTEKEMFEWMLWVYTETEEYEKCKVIKSVLDHPDN